MRKRADGRRFDIIVANTMSIIQDALMQNKDIPVRLVYFVISGFPAPEDNPLMVDADPLWASRNKDYDTIEVLPFFQEAALARSAYEQNQRETRECEERLALAEAALDLVPDAMCPSDDESGIGANLWPEGDSLAAMETDDNAP